MSLKVERKRGKTIFHMGALKISTTNINRCSYNQLRKKEIKKMQEIIHLLFKQNRKK